MAEIGNHAGNGIWPTLELASKIFDRASFALIVGTVIVLASTVFIVWMGIVKEHHWDLLREQSSERIATLGLERMREPYVKHLQGALWELRLIGRDGIARAIYVAASGKRVVIVRVFRKKTQKTPGEDLELARNNKKKHQRGLP